MIGNLRMTSPQDPGVHEKDGPSSACFTTVDGRCCVSYFHPQWDVSRSFLPGSSWQSEGPVWAPLGSLVVQISVHLYQLFGNGLPGDVFQATSSYTNWDLESEKRTIQVLQYPPRHHKSNHLALLRFLAWKCRQRQSCPWCWQRCEIGTC